MVHGLQEGKVTMTGSKENMWIYNKRVKWGEIKVTED